MEFFPKIGQLNPKKGKNVVKQYKNLDHAKANRLSSGVIKGNIFAAQRFHQFNVDSGRVNPTGRHFYVKWVPIGKTAIYGTPEDLFKKYKMNPERYFPMSYKGGPLAVGGEAILSVLPEWAGNILRTLFGTVKYAHNKVTVKELTETSVTLEATDHTFKGTATHGFDVIKDSDGESITGYLVVGEGPESQIESTTLQNLNVLFSDRAWEPLVRNKTIPNLTEKDPDHKTLD